MNIKRFFNNKSLKYGTISVAFTAIFIGMLFLINIIAGLLVERFPIKIDLSKDKLYTLSDDTLNFLKTYDKETKIIFCSSKEDLQGNLYYGAQFSEALTLFENYTKYNSNISITYINLDQNPAFAREYSKDSITGDSIIVKSGERYKVLTFSKLFEVETDQYGQSGNVTSSNAELDMTSALSYLAIDKISTIAFTKNHNEKAVAGLETLFEKNNYIIGKELSLSTDDIPAETEVVAIVAPTYDFTDSEIDKLSKYINNDEKLGKNLLVFMDPAQPSLPKLEAFLAEWGVSVLPGFIYDTRYSLGDDRNIVVDYKNTEVAGNLITKELISISPDTRPIELIFTEKNNYKVSVLLSTFEEGSPYYKADAAGEPDTDKDKKGQYNTMVMASKMLYLDNNPVQSNISVCGSAAYIDDSLIFESTFGNGDYVLNVVNNMLGNKSTINIVPKTFGNTSLNINSEQMPYYIALFLVVIPLIVVVFGIVIWLKRRHL